MYAAFAVGQGWDSGVLLDTDSEGKAAKTKIDELVLKELAHEQKARFRVFMLGSAAGVTKTDVAIGDLLGDEFYLDCVNVAFRVVIDNSDLPVDGSDMITKRVESVLVQRFGHEKLDKRRVRRELLRRFDGWEKVSDLPDGTAERAEQLFRTINKTFAAGAPAAAREDPSGEP